MKMVTIAALFFLVVFSAAALRNLNLTDGDPKVVGVELSK